MAQELPDMQKLTAFLRATPANLFFKDTECKYRFSTEQCDMVNGGAEHSILGKTDLEVQVYKEFGRIYYEDDLKILATGTPQPVCQRDPHPGRDALLRDPQKSRLCGWEDPWHRGHGG